MNGLNGNRKIRAFKRQSEPNAAKRKDRFHATQDRSAARWCSMRVLSMSPFLICLLFCLGGPPARAQVGVPVTDVANLALEVAHNLEQDALTEDVVFKVAQIYIAMRRLDNLRWRDITVPLEIMRASADGALGYGRDDLGEVFQSTFPGTPGSAGPWYLEKRGVVERLEETSLAYAENLPRQYEIWEAAATQVETYRRDLERILGPQEAYDILLALGVFEVDEWRLMRQLALQELALHTTLGSERVNEHIQSTQSLWRSLAGVGAPTN